MAEQYAEVERFEGTHAPTGEAVRPKRVWGKNDHWGGHRFSNAELDALLAGDTVSFSAVSKAGKPYEVKGALGKGEYNGNAYWGFMPQFGGIPVTFLGHKFTPGEVADLEAGKKISVAGLVGRSGKEFTANISYGIKEGDTSGSKSLILDFDK